MAELRDGTIAVVRYNIDDQRDAIRSVTLIIHLLECGALLILARSALDCSLDIILWHIDGFGAVDGKAKAEVRFRITAAFARGDRDLSRHAREYGASLRIIGGFLTFNRRPFGVSRHIYTFSAWRPGMWAFPECAPLVQDHYTIRSLREQVLQFVKRIHTLTLIVVISID
jgi:hypothetical protein